MPFDKKKKCMPSVCIGTHSILNLHETNMVVLTIRLVFEMSFSVYSHIWASKSRIYIFSAF